MADARRLFITGIAGSIGRQLAVKALAGGWQVQGLALPGEDVAALEAQGVAIARGRLEDQGSLEVAAAGATHAVHCAALLPHLAHLGKDAFQRVNVEGARAMVELTARLRLARTVMLSTCGVLGRERSGPTTDATAYRQPFDLYTWSKIEAEKAVIEASERLSAPVVILRPANVYGRGMTFKWPDVFTLVRDGKMKLIGGGRSGFSLIHVRDLVSAILAALDQARSLAPAERVLISSPERLTFGEVIASIARVLGAPPPGNVPYPLALAASYVAVALPPPLRLGRLKLLSPAVVREYRRGFEFDTSHAERSLGFRAQERFEPAIAEAIAAWREGGA